MERRGKSDENRRSFTTMTFSELYESYGKCLSPKVVVCINHKEITAKLETLQLSLSTQKKASSCSLLYRFESEKELLQACKNIKIGALFQLSLGYDDKVESVFLGYIHSLEVSQYTQDFTLELYAQDVMGLMMNQQRIVHYKEKSAQQILEDILQDQGYSSFIKKVTIDKQKDVINTYTRWADSDFETIKAICEENNRIFYMRNDEFIVEEMGTAFTPEIRFSNFGVLFVKVMHCGQNIKGNIALQGFDKEYETIECKQAVPLSKEDFDTSIYNSITQIKRYETIVDQSDLKTKAEDMGKRIALQGSSIQFSCLYLPQLLCGRKVNFEDIACIKASGVIVQLDVILQNNYFTCEGKAVLI